MLECYRVFFKCFSNINEEPRLECYGKIRRRRALCDKLGKFNG